MLDGRRFKATTQSDGNRVPAFFVDPRGCWIWTRATKSGYAVMTVKHGSRSVHRLHWEAFNGERIPKDREIDHLCRVRGCVNPAHLELVDHKTNVLRGLSPTADNYRKSECVNGHLLAGPNLYVRAEGKRACKICMRMRDKKYRDITRLSPEERQEVYRKNGLASWITRRRNKSRVNQYE